jgi:sortase A
VVRRAARASAVALASTAVALLAWTGVTLVWGEPVTALEASRAQAELRTELAQREAGWHATAADGATPTLGQRAMTYRRGLRGGDAIGSIVVPRLRLRTVLVEGTSATDLARGPGHYRITALPGLGGTVAIAGHRTTYLQPFRHIDDLKPGDRIILRMPYGTFGYVVSGHRIVDDGDWSILRRRSYEQLVLTACHPLHSASHRFVVFARLESTTPAGSRPPA